MSRVKSAARNSAAVLIYQCTGVLLSFFTRKVFISALGVSFLGYNAVFTNILSALNLTELGIGFAITSFLYKPLARKEYDRVQALMYMYRRIYQFIGILVAAIGTLSSFLLPYLIRDAAHDMGYIRLLFFINLAGTVSTYFLSYHRTVLIANQENYLTAAVDMGLNVAMTLGQLISLYLAPAYEIYLALEIMKSFVGNIVVTVICRKRYPFLREKPKRGMLEEYKKTVARFVKDAFAAKIGAYVFYSTDNLIIAYFKGSILTGFLSNYTMIVNTVQTVVVQVLTSVQAVIGNYVFSVEDKGREREMGENYLFLNFFIGNFCMICIVFLVQPFIGLFFGSGFLLPQSTALLLGVNLMLIILSQTPSQLFSIYQLFRYDKYIVAVSAFLNIVVSVALVKPLGIDGVLIGTFLTSLIYIFSRLYIIWKKVFKEKVCGIYRRILCYFAVSAVNILITWAITSFLFQENIVHFILRTVLAALSAAVVPALLLLRTREERFFLGIAGRFLKWKL